MSQMEKLVSVKGKSMLLHEGYIYTIERTKETKLVLRCQNRDCKGTMALMISQIINLNKKHF